MGTTYRTYVLKNKDISLLEVAQILWKIQDSLCVSENKLFYHSFSLTDPDRIHEIQTKFDVQCTRLLSYFTLHKYDHLYKIINSPDLFEYVSLSNVMEGVDRGDYFRYWLQINTGAYPIAIVLQVTDDFATIKSELKNIVRFLSEKELLLINDKQLDGLVDLMIDANLTSGDGTTYKGSGFEFFARGDFYPKGSNIVRPSFIQLKFDTDFYEKHGGEHRTLLAFYDAFNEYFGKDKYSIEGTVVSNFSFDTFTAIKKMDLFKFNLSVYVDLNKNAHFTPGDLLFTSAPGSVCVEKFNWRDTDSEIEDNRVCLYIENSGNWEFEIQISKKVDEDYYFNVELLINRELEEA